MLRSDRNLVERLFGEGLIKASEVLSYAQMAAKCHAMHSW
jgi:hypothetical protein